MNIKTLKISMNSEKEYKILRDMSYVLNSEISWTNSKFVGEVEQMICKNLGFNFAVAVSTCSSGIEMTLAALELNNSLIFVPSLTPSPTIISCLNLTNQIVLVDCKSNDLSMSAEDLESKIKKYYKNNKKGAIILVHIGGAIAQDTLQIVNIAKKYNLELLEDCAHAHGATLNGKPAGSFGIAGIYSFFLTKTVTSGEGGMIVTNNRELENKLKIFRNYGKNQQGDIVEKGSSWRMNEFTAVVLKHQLDYYFETGYKLRNSIAEFYNSNINNPKFHIYGIANDSTQGYYKYILIVKDENFNFDLFRNYMEKNGIILPAKVTSKLPIYEPFIKKCNCIFNLSDEFINSENLMANHICLPIYEDLKDSELDYIVQLINNY